MTGAMRLLPSRRLLLGAAAAGIVGFVLILADVLAGGLLAQLDAWIEERLAAAMAPDTRSALERFLSLPGDRVLVAALLAGSAIACLVSRRPWWAAVVFVFGVGGSTLASLLKEWVGRARPVGGAGLDSLAFPSGHATQATIGWGLLWIAAAAWAARAGQTSPAGSARWRAALLALLVVAPVVAGAGRVLGGVHWLSDVLAGWALGAATVALALLAALGLDAAEAEG